MVICRGENLTGTFYILEKFEFFGSGLGSQLGRYSRPIPYTGNNFGYSMSCGLKICRQVDHISTLNWQNYNPRLIVFAEIWPFYCFFPPRGLAGGSISCFAGKGGQKLCLGWKIEVAPCCFFQYLICIPHRIPVRTHGHMCGVKRSLAPAMVAWNLASKKKGGGGPGSTERCCWDGAPGTARNRRTQVF